MTRQQVWGEAVQCHDHCPFSTICDKISFAGADDFADNFTEDEGKPSKTVE